MMFKITAALLCISSVYSTMTVPEKTAALDTHNKLRAKVARGAETRGETSLDGTSPAQPRATNMNELMWSKGLSDIAQNFANVLAQGTSLYHNDNRNQQFASTQTMFVKKSTSIGENVAQSYTTGSSSSYSCVNSITSFYDEVNAGLRPRNNIGYSYRQINDWSGYDYYYGHYTQVVWAKTRFVGCGFARGTHNVNGQNRLYSYCVCNYYPAGNMRTQYPYERALSSSQVGSNCDTDRTVTPIKSGDNTGLCGGDMSKNYLADPITSSGTLKGNGVGTQEPTARTPAPTNKPTKKPVVLPSDNQICVGCQTGSSCPGKTYAGTFTKDAKKALKWTRVQDSTTTLTVEETPFGHAGWWGIYKTVKTVSGSRTSYSSSFIDYIQISTLIQNLIFGYKNTGLRVLNLGACQTRSQYNGGDENKGTSYLFKDGTSAVLIIIVIVQCIIITIGLVYCITQKVKNKGQASFDANQQVYQQM